jgi:hypothetical protein
MFLTRTGFMNKVARRILQTGLMACAVMTPVLQARHVRAAAPAGRYTVSNGSVFDTKTKLTWQQVVPAETLKTLADAQTYCAGLGANLGGTGWRVPTVKEFLSLVDYSQAAAPLIDPTAFPATPTDFFYTVSKNPKGLLFSFDVAHGGVTTMGNLGPGPYEVRCVR